MPNIWSSKLTTTIGLLVEILAIVDRLFKDNPIPQAREEWVSFGIKVVAGLGFILSKDYNQTHSQHPNTVAHTAPEPPTEGERKP